MILRYVFIIILYQLFQLNLFSQNNFVKRIGLNEAIDIAIKNNPAVQNSELRIQQVKVQKNAVIDLPPTRVTYYKGNIHSAINERYIEISQSFGSLPAYFQKNKLNKSEIKISESEQHLIFGELKLKLKQAWFQWIYSYQFSQLIRNTVSQIETNLPVFSDSLTDETLDIEKLEMENNYAELQSLNFKASEDVRIAANEIKKYLFTDEEIIPFDTILDLYAIDFQNFGTDKFTPTNQINFLNETQKMKFTQLQLEKAKLFPEFSLGYFNQQISGNKGFQGINVGVQIPLWYFPQKSRIKEAAISFQEASNNLEYKKFSLQKTIDNVKIKLDQLYVEISYFRENVLPLTEALEQKLLTQHQQKLIKDSDFLKQIRTLCETRCKYLGKVMEYNSTALELEYLIN